VTRYKNISELWEIFFAVRCSLSNQTQHTYRSSTIVLYYIRQHVSAVQTIVLDLYVVSGWIIGTVWEIHNRDCHPLKKSCFNNQAWKVSFPIYFPEVPVLVVKHPGHYLFQTVIIFKSNFSQFEFSDFIILCSISFQRHGEIFMVDQNHEVIRTEAPYAFFTLP